MKKRIIIIAGIALILAASVFSLLAFAGNTGFREEQIKLDDNYNEFITDDELKKKGHLIMLPEYNSDSSVGFKNIVGTKTLYVYASPIRFLDTNGKYSFIDNRLSNLKDDANASSYAYTTTSNDIIPFYPKTLSSDSGIKLVKGDFSYSIVPITSKKANAKVTEKTNFIGKNKNMVIYNEVWSRHVSLAAYPTSIGTNLEIEFKPQYQASLEFNIQISDPAAKIRREQGGYLVIFTNEVSGNGEITEEIKGIIQMPIIKVNEDVIINDISCNISEEDGNYSVSFDFGGNDKLEQAQCATAEISLEIRRNKQPDNTLYSKKATLTNAYLSNYAVIGHSNDYGIGRLLIRYVFAKKFSINSSDVLSAYYNTFCLTKEHDSYSLLTVLDE